MPTPVSDFDFDLPESLIAQEASPRGESRLLVVDRTAGSWSERRIGDLPELLSPGDLIVANDTRVFPARLIGRRVLSKRVLSKTPGAAGHTARPERSEGLKRPSDGGGAPSQLKEEQPVSSDSTLGGVAECFLLERVGDDEWEALVHPGQKLKPGARLRFEDDARAPGVRIDAEVLDRRFFGRRLVRFAVTGAATLDVAVDRLGHVPLPPYIHREERPDDRERYQTIFAKTRGSVAAPTAGLHFNEALVARLIETGIGWSTITLHVGYGTFKPVRVDLVDDHKVDAERYVINDTTSSAIAAARSTGHRVVAIGTTTTRALESAALETGAVVPGEGRTELFIHQGHQFRAVDALVTNFHLPRSSLLMLVAAFGGKDLVMAAYRDAVRSGFRFYSYGDAMLIL